MVSMELSMVWLKKAMVKLKNKLQGLADKTL